MKSWIESLCIALAMYSALPVKCFNWTKENLKHALVFFPLVGVLCGGALGGVWFLCRKLEIGAMLFAILAVGAVLLVTGGIHLDGFCDTADALFSRRSREEKLRILKDPNCGPFAVCSVIFILLLSVGAMSEIVSDLDASAIGLLTGGFVVSRCMSGISITRLPCTATSSLAKTFGENAGRSVSYVLGVELLLTCGALIWAYRLMAFVLLGTMLLLFLLFYRMQKKQFGGLTGDLAGFLLVLCETAWLLETALLGGVLL